jgi:hypothetical protein
MEESMIIEVWDTFKEYISEKHKDNAAAQYVDYLLGKEMPISVLESYIGYDSHLDDAIKTVVAEEKGFDEEEEDLDDFNEDEDY